MICEFAVGRASQKSISLAYDVLEPKNTKWHCFKWSGMLGNYLLMMFYTMVGGWMLNYACQAATGKLQGLGNAAVKENFDFMLASPKTMIFWMVLAVLLSLGVCAMGLQNGVEKITKVMMSILIILMVVLELHSLTLEGAMDGVKFYLIPDFLAMKKIGIGSVVFAALSTIIAVCENIISFYMDMLGWKRKKAVAVNVAAIILLSLPAVLGYNVWSGFSPLGKGTTIMDLEDFLVSYNILPLGGLIFVLFCVRKNGWGFSGFLEEANTGTGRKLPNWIRYYMTYVLPCIIVIVYLKGYYDIFVEKGTEVLIGWMAFAFILLGIIFGISFYQGKDRNDVLN